MLRNKDEVNNLKIILPSPSITQTKSKCLGWMVGKDPVQRFSSWTSMKHCLHHKHYQDCLHDDHGHGIEIDVIFIIFQEILWFDKSKMVLVGLSVPFNDNGLGNDSGSNSGTSFGEKFLFQNWYFPEFNFAHFVL